MRALSSRNRQFWWRGLQVALLLISLIFLGQAILGHWTTVRQTATGLDWSRFAGAVGLLFVALGMLPAPTYLALRASAGTHRITYADAVRAFFVSQAAKYLPGGLWAVPGRTILYQGRHGIPPAQGAFLVLWELLAVLAAALLVGTLSLSLSGDALSLLAILATATALLVIGTALAQRATFWRRAWLGRWQVTQTLAASLEEGTALGPGTLLSMTVAAAAFWLLTGVAFHNLLLGVTATNAVPWHAAAGVYALAWLAGFLVVIVPAGLGFREGALTLLLSALLPPGQAVLIAVLARLWWLLAEAAWIGVGLILLKV